MLVEVEESFTQSGNENWSKWNPMLLRQPLSEKLKSTSNHGLPLSVPQCSSLTNGNIVRLKLVNPNKIKATAETEKPVLEPPRLTNIGESLVDKTSELNVQHPKRNNSQNEVEIRPLKIAKTSSNLDRSTHSSATAHKKKTQLTMDCRIKINTLSEAKLELVNIQKDCLIKEHVMKQEEHDLKIKQTKAEHEIIMKKHTLELELLKIKLSKEASKQK